MARSHGMTQVGRDSVNVTLDDGISAGLRRFAAELRDKALRPAAHAAAKVLHDEIEQRVPVESGLLKSAIYRWHDDKQSRDGRQVYAVGVNKRKAPHWYNVEFGHWRYNKIVNGHPQKSKSNPKARGPGAHDLPGALETPQWVPAKPYIRPAYDAKIGAAVDAAKVRLAEKLKEIT